MEGNSPTLNGNKIETSKRGTYELVNAATQSQLFLGIGRRSESSRNKCLHPRRIDRTAATTCRRYRPQTHKWLQRVCISFFFPALSNSDHLTVDLVEHCCCAIEILMEVRAAGGAWNSIDEQS